MKNWSIKLKLGLLCGSLMALVLLVIGVGMYSEDLIKYRLHYIKDIQLQSVRAMSLVDMVHDGLRAVVFRAIIVSDKTDTGEKKEVAEELREMSQMMNDQMTVLHKLELSKSARKMVDDSEPPIRAYLKSAEEIVAFALSGRKDQAFEKIPEFQAAFNHLEEALGKVGDRLTNDAEADQKEAEKREENLSTVALFIKISGLILGLVISIFTVRSLVKTLTLTIDELSHSNGELSKAAEQMSSSADVLSDASTRQAASLQQAMASTEEISAMVNRNAESADRVQLTVEANQATSDAGAKSVDDMLVAIDDIKKTNESIVTQMEDSNKEFAEIVKIITSIGERTKVINDIVFQTKLLSFNASVEAARAGEHGKGFAVVAEEVGNLAQMSGNAAKEISDMLSTSVQQVNGIVQRTSQRVDHLVEIGKDKIIMGQSTAQKCRDSLTAIADNATAVTSGIKEITLASKEQAQGVQEINSAISQLDQSTQQNSQIAKEGSTQANKLNHEARALSKTIRDLVVLVRGGKPDILSVEELDLPEVSRKVQ